MPTKNNYIEVILEDINAKFNRLIEVVAGMQEQLTRKADKSDIKRVEDRLDVIEYSVKQTNTAPPTVTKHALQGLRQKYSNQLQADILIT